MKARQAARARHPSTQWKPDLERMAQRVAERLAARGHPWPDRAGAVLAHRGSLGLDREAYARRIGVDPESLAALEESRETP